MYWRQPLVNIFLSLFAFRKSYTLFSHTLCCKLCQKSDHEWDNTDIDCELLACLLRCLYMTLTTAFQTLLESAGGTFMCDFSSSTFASLNELTMTSSTSTSLSKMDAETSLMQNNFYSFNLVLSSTTGATMAMTVTFTESNPLTGLVGHGLNISSRIFRIASVSGTFGGTVYPTSIHGNFGVKN